MRERPEDEVMQKNYLDFWRNKCISLAYMTGILPVKKLCKRYGMDFEK